MDPKMDAGMNCDTILTLDERLEKGTIPLDSDLSVTQIVGLMDQLLCCEVM